jgi:hypothetical protein
MSTHRLRHEKNCLNCGFRVEERFCSRCGQENLEPKEGFGHLVGHFFADITHFDSKIFTTIKDLVLKPGFLTREYAEGRRVRYLNPIRMYVFISAIFFLVIYWGKGESSAEVPQRSEGYERGGGVAKQPRRSSASEVGAKGGDGGGAKDSAQAVKPGKESLAMKYSGSTAVFDLVENKYQTVHEFDSVQSTLPDSSREHGMMRWIIRNNIRLKQKHGGRNKLHLETNVQHTIPKLMFVLLPLFALFVGMLYSRRKYYYSQHAIFSVHFHSFFFLIMIIAALVDDLYDAAWIALGLPAAVLVLAFIYLVAALWRMFGQSVWLSFVKAGIVTVLYTLSIIVAFMVVLVLTFLAS